MLLKWTTDLIEDALGPSPPRKEQLLSFPHPPRLSLDDFANVDSRLPTNLQLPWHLVALG